MKKIAPFLLLVILFASSALVWLETPTWRTAALLFLVHVQADGADIGALHRGQPGELSRFEHPDKWLICVVLPVKIVRFLGRDLAVEVEIARR